MAYSDVVGRIIGTESGGNPYDRNPRSSAYGSGQFINSTWLDMIRRHRPDIAAGRTDDQLLALRSDPNLSRDMTQAYAQDNAGFLKSRGIDPTPGALKLAHFAGPGGAAAIYADPGKTVEALLGSDAVRANPFLAGKTGADTIDWANRQMGGGGNDVSSGAHAVLMNALKRTTAGPSTQPAAADSAAPAAGPATGLDRLTAALSGKGYDPDKISTGEQLMQSGQEIGAKAINPIGAIGATLLSGIGGAIAGDEEQNRKAFNEQLRTGLSNAPDSVHAARLLMSSPDARQQQLGLELFAKTQRADEWTPTADGSAVVNKSTGEIRRTGVERREQNLPDEVKKYNFDMAQRQALGQKVIPYQDWQIAHQEQKPLTAADKEAILKAEEMTLTNKSAIGNLDKALKENDKAYSGFFPQTRGWLTSLYGAEGGKATEDVSNLIGTQAVQQLRAIFGGAPTEGERQVLLDLAGSVKQAPEVRKEIWERAKGLAENRLRLNQMQAEQIRDRTYFKPGGGLSPNPDAGSGGNPDQPKAVKTFRFNAQTGELEEK